MKTKPFDLQEALKGAKVVTRGGVEVEVIGVSKKEIVYPVAAIIQDDSSASSFTKEGRYSSPTSDHGRDLFILVEPKLRPWKPDEVPVGAVIRKKNDPSFGRRLILCAGPILPAPPFWGSSEEDLLQEYEHSTDNGKTWLPCGVEETHA